LDDLKSKIDVQNDNLTGKKKELGHIVEETEKEEIELTKNSEELEASDR
jgi:hypothetical protein